MYERVLLTLDGSHRAEQSLPYAAEIARRFDSTLILLGVVERMVLRPGETEPELSHEIIRRYLESVAERLRPDALKTEIAVVEDPPAVAILNYIRENAIDLVVMSSHGRSHENRVAYGPVAERVLRESPAPVLLIKSGHAAEKTPAGGVAQSPRET